MHHSSPNKQRQTIEFWFDFGSNYSYLTAMRIEDLAGSIGVDIVWKPFLLGPIFQSFGWESSPFVLQKQKGEYTWKDMERQAHKHGIAWKKPSTFPRRAILPTRVAILGRNEKWIGDFVRATMARNFVEDKDLDTEDAVREVLAAINVISMLGKKKLSKTSSSSKKKSGDCDRLSEPVISKASSPSERPSW